MFKKIISKILIFIGAVSFLFFVIPIMVFKIQDFMSTKIQADLIGDWKNGDFFIKDHNNLGVFKIKIPMDLQLSTDPDNIYQKRIRYLGNIWDHFPAYEMSFYKGKLQFRTVGDKLYGNCGANDGYDYMGVECVRIFLTDYQLKEGKGQPFRKGIRISKEPILLNGISRTFNFKIDGLYFYFKADINQAMYVEKGIDIDIKTRINFSNLFDKKGDGQPQFQKDFYKAFKELNPVFIPMKEFEILAKKTLTKSD